MDKTKDDAFRNFLEKIQGQNKAGLLINTLQLKYERETAGEDADKREEQLEQLATAFENVEKAITGMSVKFEFQPLINALENQTQILQKSLEEQALLRKVSEGSLEYDKESAQYRNVSGKELTSDVSGKTIKQGAYVDFETAANRLQGQGKRVRESEQNQITFKPVELGKKTTVTGQPGDVTPKREKDEETTGFGNIGDLGKAVGARLKGIYDFMTNKVDKKEDVDAKPEITGINPESDNIQSTQEVMAESAKKDVELTGINNDLLEQQLKELKKISAALAPSAPSELPEGRLKAGRTGHEVAGGGDGGGGGGLGLGDALSGMGGLAKKAGGAIVKGAKVVGKGALSLGGGIAKFAASGAGKALGATAAIGLGAYTAYKGYTAAEDSKQSKLDEVQAKVDSGEMKPEEAATARKQIGNTATVEKSGAVGEGTGMAAGAIAGGMAGAKLGAAIGSIIPGAGTVVGAGIGTIAGGALGAFAGSSAGKYVGEKVGSGINAVKGFFGGKTDAPGAATKEALGGMPVSDYEAEANKIAKDELKNGANPVNLEAIVLEKLEDKFPKVDRQILEFQADIAATKAKSNKNEAPAASKPVVEKKPAGTATGTLSDEKGLLAKTADAAKSIGSSVAGFLGFRGKTDAPGKITPKETVDGKTAANATVIGDVRGGLTEDQFKYATSMQGGKYKNSLTDKDGKEIEGDVARIKAMREGRDATNATLSGSFKDNPTPRTTGSEVSRASTENSDLNREANMRQSAVQPIISSNVSNNNTQSFVPIKPSPRSERSGSALDRYNDRVSAY